MFGDQLSTRLQKPKPDSRHEMVTKNTIIQDLNMKQHNEVIQKSSPN